MLLPRLEVTKVANSTMTAPGHYATGLHAPYDTVDINMYNVAVYDGGIFVSPMFVDSSIPQAC